MLIVLESHDFSRWSFTYLWPSVRIDLGNLNKCYCCGGDKPIDGGASRNIVERFRESNVECARRSAANCLDDLGANICTLKAGQRQDVRWGPVSPSEPLSGSYGVDQQRIGF